ncbi:hypothetical protein GZH47_23110 [Paenibacillus rhizovicinus]|uniref:Uncharacterized protein n=1 Tax=Paenibacillus rhizovicinus TaxID=2704463 RepID=A0A6C0P4L8_9BACL|nr:hypothetical protein [Paenibacillus rhizovicinus]QHW33397.1 hypothetical protein GZH47_23110 [Paenibacillus rhizovicinus]
MFGMILLATVVGGALLTWLRIWNRGARRVLDLLAVLAYILFFTEAAHAIMKTLLDDTVFMTQVHEVLLSWPFLISGSYMGPYGMSLLFAQLRTRDK